VFETKARLAELAVLERRPDEAVALADEVLTTTEESESGATLRARSRVRAGAQGDATCMAEALRWSLDVAREAEETYEVALTLEAMARLQGDEDAADESRGLLARLGVVSTPEVPL
jgi:hypothetical protein